MNTTTKKITFTALMMAIVFITTFFVKIPIPRGYIHPGDAGVYLSGILLGPYLGFAAAAIGSSFADYFAGYSIYIIPTFLAKGIMAFIVGYFSKKIGDQGIKKLILPMILAGLLMTLIYYFAEVIMYGSFYSPLVNIPFTIAQFVLGIVISLLLYKPLSRYALYHKDEF
jgi:uncharacterized membrane protein